MQLASTPSHLSSSLNIIDEGNFKMPEPYPSNLPEWSVEIDFLVAAERPYVGVSHPPERDRWVCPAFVHDINEACIQQCTVRTFQAFPDIGHDIGGIGYRSKANAKDFVSLIDSEARKDMPATLHNWMFSPSANATANDDSPKEYDWVGVKMRCPFRADMDILPETIANLNLKGGNTKKVRRNGIYHVNGSPTSSDSGEHSAHPPPGSNGPLDVEDVLAALRDAIVIHVNSSCQMRFYLTRRPDGFTLTHAKRMVTLTWMLEQELLLKLRPNVSSPCFDHSLPITTSSNLAKKKSFLLEDRTDESPATEAYHLRQSWPRSEYKQEIMSAHIPLKLKDPALQERIHFIWGAENMKELADLMRNPEGKTTVTLNTYRNRAQPVFVLRYTSWHPQAESMHYWLQLVGKMWHFATTATCHKFSKKVIEIDDTLVAVKKIDEADRWKPLLLTMRLHNATAYHWARLKSNECEGGCLSPKNLDKQGIWRSEEDFQFEADSDDSGHDNGRY